MPYPSRAEGLVNSTIRFFSVISGILVGSVLLLHRDAAYVFYSLYYTDFVCLFVYHLVWFLAGIRWSVYISKSQGILQSIKYVYFQTDTTLEKYGLPYPHQLLMKLYHCCSSTRVTLELNNPWKLICHQTKKPNQTYLIIIIIIMIIW